jgi:uncharacterized protein
MLEISDVEEFVRKDYETKDAMHDLSHIRRILRTAQKLTKNHVCDNEFLTLGAYFHGLIRFKEPEIRDFLSGNDLTAAKIDKVVQIAWESQKEAEPQSIEGRILHDAHLIEGGKTFLITKSLVTGSARGQSLEETIAYLESHILGKHRCYLSEAQQMYEEKEKFAREFLNDLKNNL